MIKIIGYTNCANESIEAYYNEDMERVVIINYDTEQSKIISELKNMNSDMLEFIIKDFKRINFLGEDFKIEYDDIDWLKDCENSGAFFKEILENTNNRELEEMLRMI